MDTVHYEDLLVGREYTVKGVLMNKSTEAPLLVDGERVEAETIFTPDTTSGDVDVTFTFNAKGLAGQEVVAFESLYASGQLIASHEDLDDENQTVQFKKPNLKTTATDVDGSKDIEPTDKRVVDIVNYTDLIAGKELLGETTFTPEEPNGAIEVYFDLNARELADKDVVVFEKLYRNGKEVAVHEDIDDASQTVYFTPLSTKPEPPNNPPSNPPTNNKPGSTG
ncbi:VaFE repeat-containing surface-anchored protein [Listeria rocourtiae]|uniref:VaFE repeat-containing surface-anchored protein n=1 Tax=Listeria rocourtiae TaxID=647910 RepID=UPI001625E23B|nr:VaFE repeat-containing surface-anchored protein [Listeria rocourtiae]MBC1434759.1 VaFE repeat-containing surface-anchored protein [Listeria rocourtiae]